MEKVVVVMYRVDQKAAIRAGKADYGKVETAVNPGALTPAQREELAICSKVYGSDVIDLQSLISGRHEGGIEVWPVIAEPADDVPARILDARIAIRKRREERIAEADAAKARMAEERAAFDAKVGEDPGAFVTGEGVSLAVVQEVNDHLSNCRFNEMPHCEALRADVREKVHAAREAVKAELERVWREAWTAFIKKHGTPEQLERFEAGVLPLHELNEMAEEVFFKSFDFPLYENIDDCDVTAECDAECYSSIKFESISCSSKASLDASQWATLKAIRAITVPEAQKTEIEIRRHRGYCEECDAEVFAYGVRVTVRWNTHIFQREFALNSAE